MKFEEYFLFWILINFIYVIERFCFYLDSVGKMVNVGVFECVVFDDVNEFVEVFVFGREVWFWLGVLIFEIGFMEENK